ncbi:Nodulin-like / Major Facilitator Superfamily protein [Zostera marina]|uniref:Nodulin-like / Major Facilitator Superfamily protein n=1 Tax=Zostera marina TaxID=29655 RepID=A0A0K9PA12_ZOSMR|nr:Nodulin-like / Major Facilitator Superfamily protein [Zostera marina]
MRSSSKWGSTAASMWIQSTSGGSYCFGIYSPLLKSSQSYNQTTLNYVSFFKDIGANVGVLSGLLYSSCISPSHHSSSSVEDRKRGPWIVIATGAVQCFVGYFMMWLSVTGMVSRPPVVAMCLYMFLATHAQTFFNTADIVTTVENFPQNRGTVVGIMKGFLGLSGAILIETYHVISTDDPSSMILMLALLPTFLPLLLMWLVNVHHGGCYNEDDDTRYLNRFSALSLLVASYLMGLIIWENAVPIESVIRVVTFVILLLLLISPAWFVFTLNSSIPSNTMSTALIVEHNPSEERVSICKNDQNLLQAIRGLDFWLLFISMACGMGSGMATVNNMSQIGGSLNYTPVEISTLISLWSIWNFLGRFLAGRLSDYFLNTRGYPRPIFISATLAAMSIGHLTIASAAFPGALYLGSVVVGICYGSQWSLMPTITSELFGMAHLGTIFNTISVASPLGSYVLSVKVTGYLFDKVEEEQASDDCSGPQCFRLSFMIMAVVALNGCAFSSALFLRTRKFYRELFVKNFT